MSPGVPEAHPRPPLVLASASPQRRAILAQVGIPFEARPTGAAELETGDPLEVAAENARRKARAAPAGPDELVLAADTLVAAAGALLGKPRDERDAREHLRRLAGSEHRVFGGIALARGGEVVAEAVEVTRVCFRPVGEAEIEWYLATGEWRERAGAYAIQGAGAALVAAIDGDYLNVVGLPLARLLDMAPYLLPVQRF